MKRISVILICLSFSVISWSQLLVPSQTLSFDTTFTYPDTTVFFEVDSLSIWHVGQPNKSVFDSAHSFPNAIFTMDSGFYPPNDTSSFLVGVHNLRSWSRSTFLDAQAIQIKYLVDTDSLNDYGFVEISTDNQQTWHLLEDPDEPNAFTGRTKSWQNWLMWMPWGPDLTRPQADDTVYFKFTFVSDSISEQREGWIIDDIGIYDHLSINEYQFDFASNAFPNPASDRIKIEFENRSNHLTQIEILNESGRLVHGEEGKANQFTLSTEDLTNGLYFYRLFNTEERTYSAGRFIVAK